ncbi:MAG TPA: SPOR domain-containing protein [Terriglobia bacterium]|nr:SPOR domain-containing protein [Terriglobia bacterium]
MEESTTSWKNHSFTMLIFGGIVVLCSIFFVLGMLVGRNQGQKIAETAFRQEEAKKSVAAPVSDDLPLNFYSETTAPNPNLTLQPAPRTPEPPAMSSASPVGGASSSAPARRDSPKESVQPPAKAPTVKATPTNATSTKTTTAKPAVARPPSKPVKEAMLQIAASRDGKKAQAERKKVESMGFSARVISATDKGVQWHRVYVGPFKESEVKLKKADLKAKGYKDVLERW